MFCEIKYAVVKKCHVALVSLLASVFRGYKECPTITLYCHIVCIDNMFVSDYMFTNVIIHSDWFIQTCLIIAAHADYGIFICES